MVLLLLACAHAPLTPRPPIAGAEVLYFDLEGGDRIDLLQSCMEGCPRDEADVPVTSLTAWSVAWTWTRHPYEPCEVASATLHVDVTVTLPRWAPPEDADAELVDEWRTYLDALAQHEQGHVDVVHRLASGTEALLPGVPCADAHAASASLLGYIREQGHAYDALTDSGRLQGADFWRLEGRAARTATGP